jgi:hypothetical protein
MDYYLVAALIRASGSVAGASFTRDTPKGNRGRGETRRGEVQRQVTNN